MVIPVRGDIYEVDIIALAELLIALGTGINRSRGKAGLAESLLALLSALGFIIAKSNNLYTGNIGKTGNSTRATHTKAHECHANSLHLGSRQAHYVLLPLRTHGRLYHKGTLVPTRLGVRRQRLCLQPTHSEEGEERQRQYSIQFHMYT
jgi:hypothetical protein